MQPVPGWDTTPAYTGEVMQLPAGLYICIVKQVNIRQDAGGREQVVLLFDIAEGEQKGFYQRQFDSRRQQDSNAKWSGVYRQHTHDRDGQSAKSSLRPTGRKRCPGNFGRSGASTA